MPASPSARRRFGSLFLAVALFVLQMAPVIAAEITTDLWVYQYGDTVTVTGVDFGPEESVELVTTDPYAVEVDRGTAQTDIYGGFTYQFVLLSDVLGIYDVVATGLSSGLTAATQFDPPGIAISNAAFAWHRVGEVVNGFDVTASGNYDCRTSGNVKCSPSSVVLEAFLGAGTSVVPGAVQASLTDSTYTTQGNNIAWSMTLRYRSVGADEWITALSDGTFDLRATLNRTFCEGGGCVPSAGTFSDYKDDFFGVDTTDPTSSVASVTAGSTPSADGSATDPGAAGTFSGFSNSQNPNPVCVEIRTNPGDALVAGSGECLTLNGLGVSKQTGTWEYTYPAIPPLSDGDYCFVSTATDEAGNTEDPGEPDADDCFTVGSANVDPTADAGGPYSGAEGDSISLDGTSSSDDGLIVSYLWAVTPQSGGLDDPDPGASCTFVDGTLATDSQPKVACNDDGLYDVSLIVGDDDGGSDADSTTLDLSNANPAATDNFPIADVNEGSTFTLQLTSPTDPGTNDTFTYQFDCGDGAGYGAAGVASSRICSTVDDASLAVGLKILDDDGGSAEYTGTVTVLNVNPLVAVPSFSQATVDCQTSAALTAISFSDPGLVDYPWEVNINWGDGSSDTNYDTYTPGGQPNQNHVYSNPGGYTATVDVTDKDDGIGSNAADITVEQTYSVEFLRPFDGSSVFRLITNTMKAGRVVPVKVVIVDDCTGDFVTGTSGETVTIDVSLKSGGTIIPTDPIEQYVTDAGASNGNTLAFRWTSDPTVAGGGFWIFNLDSRSLGLQVNTCYRIDVNVDAGDGKVLATDDEWAILKPVK